MRLSATSWPPLAVQCLCSNVLLANHFCGHHTFLHARRCSVAHFLKTIFISFVMSMLIVPFVSLLSLHRLLVLCHDSQRHQLRWKVAESTQCFCSPEWNVWLLADSTHRLRVQLLKLHEREVHAQGFGVVVLVLTWRKLCS